MNNQNSQEQTQYLGKNERLPHEQSDPFTGERYRQLAAFIKNPEPKILDVGCSKGEGGIVLNALCPGSQITGLDCVPSHLAELPSVYTERIEGLTTQIPAADQTFDVVVAAEFLEHLYPRDVDLTLCEFQRVLKVGGKLLMTTPNPAYLRNKLTRRSVFGRSHLTQHHADILKSRLLGHGFLSVCIYGSGKVSRYLGCRMPILCLYGSYAIVAFKR